MAHPRNGRDKNQVLCVKIHCAALLLSVAVYWNGIFGDYVHDDLSVVVQNRDVQGTTPLTQVFLNDFWGRRLDHPLSHKSYRPIVILSFRFETWLLGHSVASVSHAVNILLHCVVVSLYTHVLLRVLLLPTAAVLLSAALFAVHPVHTEAVFIWDCVHKSHGNANFGGDVFHTHSEIRQNNLLNSLDHVVRPVTGVVGRADLTAAVSFLASFLAYHRFVIKIDICILLSARATESRQRLTDQRREEALQRSRSTSAFTGSGPLSLDFQRTQAGNYSASENYATARKPIKKNRKFKISDRPRKKGNGLGLYKGSHDAFDTKLVEHKIGFHFPLGLKYFLKTFLSILGYSCMKCFTNTHHSSPILKNKDERHRPKSIQPYQNTHQNQGKDAPFIACTKRSLGAIFCRSSRTASRDVSSRRVPLWWCYSWAVLGVLCKEQAVTVLALCILWDALQTYGRSLRERMSSSEIRLLLTRSTQTFVLDNAPRHEVKLFMSYLMDQGEELMDRLPQSQS
ncbi:hypothetical protein FHG87_001858 [Trinorchestia longiramus]|nr:hypothetical protein FHG87_001858 [Trinorchestia longiramus]